MHPAPHSTVFKSVVRRTASLIFRRIEFMMDIDLWEKICVVIPVLGDLKVPCEQCTEEQVQTILEYIYKNDLTEYVEDLTIKKIQLELRQQIVPEFWKFFSLGGPTYVGTDFCSFERFRDAVNHLYASLQKYVITLKRLNTVRELGPTKSMRVIDGENNIFATFKAIVRASLHSRLPLNHSLITEQFYRISFKVFSNSDRLNSELNDSAEEVLQCEGCGHEVEHCQCNLIIGVFHSVNKKLVELELLERIAGEVITSLIHLKIENHVALTCKGSFDQNYIKVLEDWLEFHVMGWLTRLYHGESTTPLADSVATQEAIKKFKQKLSHFLYETYTRTRIDQLFNIIIEYPDSQPAVEDLRLCLEKTDLRPCLMQTLQRELETRLLHPGVNTPDVLTAYVAAIRALRQLDPTGVLLETVTQPVRQYLRWRDDTVRCVVGSLTEDGPGELADELVRGNALHVDQGSPPDESTDKWESWNPDPVDADPTKTSKSRRTSDIISMLVTVYGSKDVFVNEYRTLLADRLLNQLSYNTEKEIRYLELLKLRFGENLLHYCEVMLKDVYDSKRINVHLHSDPIFNLHKLDYPPTAMILSAQFWPPFKDESLELPASIKENLDIYTKCFETLKGNRTLNWKHHLGSVNMDIELKDRKINLNVSPIHATILLHFQTQNQWTIEELSVLMKVPATVLRRKIAYWQSQGILREISTDSFLLMEESPTRIKSQNPAEMVCEDEETESAMASAHDQREEELQVFWSYIVGMLTNLDSMPLERIHQMLKMFASQGPTAVECSLQELRHFLDRKVRDHKLLFSGGYYKLPKP